MKSNYPLVGIEVIIKPLKDLPANPTHMDFGGQAKRLLIKTTGNIKQDERNINSFCNSIKFLVNGGMTNET